MNYHLLRGGQVWSPLIWYKANNRRWTSIISVERKEKLRQACGRRWPLIRTLTDRKEVHGRWCRDSHCYHPPQSHLIAHPQPTHHSFSPRPPYPHPPERPWIPSSPWNSSETWSWLMAAFQMRKLRYRGCCPCRNSSEPRNGGGLYMMSLGSSEWPDSARGGGGQQGKNRKGRLWRTLNTVLRRVGSFCSTPRSVVDQLRNTGQTLHPHVPQFPHQIKAFIKMRGFWTVPRRPRIPRKFWWPGQGGGVRKGRGWVVGYDWAV